METESLVSIALEDTRGDHSTHLSLAERVPPPAASVLIACEIQDSDLSSDRGIFLDVLPGGCERIQRFNPNRYRGEVRAFILVQRWELVGLEGRVCGCAWSSGDDLRRTRDRIFGDDL